jgi:uncharacterized protein YkwD
MGRLGRHIHITSALIAAALLTACGGGGGGGGGRSAPPAASPSTPISITDQPNSPRALGDMAADGINWFNYRRQQAGLAALARNSLLDKAAAGHSNYQRLNDTITHTQVAGRPGFTGANLIDRLNAAAYVFDQGSYSYGEVISATGDKSGFNAAEELIAAIYHRFVIFEPRFKELGAGVGSVPDGYTYFTTNFAANGLAPGLGRGGLVQYPVNGQTKVPRNFFSDRETPDPISGRNEVGYPISVHADITARVAVQSFTLRPRGGSPLATHLLSADSDTNTGASVAAIVPLEVLAAGTVYDARFTGTVGGVQVDRSWSFTTQ